MFPVVRVIFFHDVLSGLSGSLLWGALLLLTIFCLYQSLQNRRISCLDKSDTKSPISDDDTDDNDVDITQYNDRVDCGLPRCPSNSNQLPQATSVLEGKLFRLCLHQCLGFSLFCVMFIGPIDRRLRLRCI